MEIIYIYIYCLRPHVLTMEQQTASHIYAMICIGLTAGSNLSLGDTPKKTRGCRLCSASKQLITNTLLYNDLQSNICRTLSLSLLCINKKTHVSHCICIYLLNYRWVVSFTSKQRIKRLIQHNKRMFVVFVVFVVLECVYVHSVCD